MDDSSIAPDFKRKNRISPDERARRQAADDYARGSLRLEGFIPSAFSDAATRRYIDGEITREQLTAATRAHHGVVGEGDKPRPVGEREADLVRLRLSELHEGPV